MSVYIVAQIEIHNRDEYVKYEAGFMEVFARSNGRLLAVDEDPQVLEGACPFTRTVLLEFPSRREVMAWYESDDYQALAKHRFAASAANISVIAGVGHEEG